MRVATAGCRGRDVMCVRAVVREKVWTAAREARAARGTDEEEDDGERSEASRAVFLLCVCVFFAGEWVGGWVPFL